MKKQDLIIGLISLFVISCGGNNSETDRGDELPIDTSKYQVSDTSSSTSVDSIPESEFDKYDFIDTYSEGLARVKKDDKYGFINEDRQEVIEPQFKDAGWFYNKRARVLIDEKWGFINLDGEETIEAEYDQVGNFSEGLARVELDNKKGFIDTTGKEVIPLEYDWVGKFENNITRVSKNQKWGFINKSNTIIIPLEYQAARDFKEGLAAIWKEGKWGYVNQQGQVLIPLKYDRVEDFVETKMDEEKEDSETKILAKVYIGAKEFFINQKGDCEKNCE